MCTLVADDPELWRLFQAVKIGDEEADEGVPEEPHADSSVSRLSAGAARRAEARREKGLDEAKPEEAQEACPSCGGAVFTEEAQYICKGCNTVVGRVIDTSAEWRYYGNDDSRGEDPTRCGMPTNDLLPKSSLGSMVGGYRGESLVFRRLRKYQIWNSMPYSERTLYAVFDTLVSNTVSYGIPNKVLDDAKVLYKKASERKISRGENKEGLIASCVYYACIMNHVPRSPKEVAKMFHIDPMVLTKGNARFQELIQINMEPSSAVDYISRFGSRLDMSMQDIATCKQLARRMEDMEIVSENAPTSAAAGILYFFAACQKLPLTKKHIAGVCDVSEMTVNKCYKRILRFKPLVKDELGDDPVKPRRKRATA